VSICPLETGFSRADIEERPRNEAPLCGASSFHHHAQRIFIVPPQPKADCIIDFPTLIFNRQADMHI